MHWTRKALKAPAPDGSTRWVTVFEGDAADGHLEAVLYDPAPEQPHLQLCTVVHYPDPLAEEPDARWPTLAELADLLDQHFPKGAQLALPTILSHGRRTADGPTPRTPYLPCILIQSPAGPALTIATPHHPLTGQ